eukprot:scaffold145_cov261-Pinguiococcus_pyrenoidosus.AAC.22
MHSLRGLSSKTRDAAVAADLVDFIELPKSAKSTEGLPARSGGCGFLSVCCSFSHDSAQHLRSLRRRLAPHRTAHHVSQARCRCGSAALPRWRSGLRVADVHAGQEGRAAPHQPEGQLLPPRLQGSAEGRREDDGGRVPQRPHGGHAHQCV